MTHNLYLYVTHFYDPKPSGPESGPILSLVPDVFFDLYKMVPTDGFQSLQIHTTTTLQHLSRTP